MRPNAVNNQAENSVKNSVGDAQACLNIGTSDIFRRVENISWLNPVKARVFATTRWSLVRACSDTDATKAHLAVAEVCQSYWQPVYACIRHHGYSAHDAEDMTQDFFVRLLGGKYFAHLDHAKGRFRAYLAAALQNFLRDRWRRWTLRRGRGQTIIPLEPRAAENSYAYAVTNATPEAIYERQWARIVINHSLEQLQIELAADRKEILLGHFEAILAGDTHNFPYVSVAKTLNVSVGALHASLHRWRERFHTLMREEIARTVFTKGEVDDEMRHLFRVFAQE